MAVVGPVGSGKVCICMDYHVIIDRVTMQNWIWYSHTFVTKDPL